MTVYTARDLFMLFPSTATLRNLERCVIQDAREDSNGCSFGLLSVETVERNARETDPDMLAGVSKDRASYLWALWAQAWVDRMRARAVCICGDDHDCRALGCDETCEACNA